MNKQQIKSKILEISKSENVTFIEACQAMQAAAALKGDENMISVIHEIKMDSLK